MNYQQLKIRLADLKFDVTAALRKAAFNAAKELKPDNGGSTTIYLQHDVKIAPNELLNHLVIGPLGFVMLVSNHQTVIRDSDVELETALILIEKLEAMYILGAKNPQERAWQQHP